MGHDPTDVVTIPALVHNDGTGPVTIPARARDELGIEGGERVVVTIQRFESEARPR